MKTWIASLKVLAFFTLVTGIAYPLFVTGISQVVFSKKANGSLIYKDDKVIGSELIGQNFKSEKYFWSRPSAIEYKPLPSGGTNLGPTSEALKKQVEERKAQGFVKDMLYASGSGLDPHISPEAAMSQVPRLLSERQGISEERIMALIDQFTEKRDFGLFGEPRVNVLKLNLALDQM